MTENTGTVEIVSVSYDDLPNEVKETIEKAVNQRTKVSALIELNQFTKAEMSILLGITTQSISSQMSYLRIANKFIKYDENRVYSFCSEEEFNSWTASRVVSTKSKRPTKSPVEQANVLAKSIKRQTTQKANLEAKLEAFDASENTQETTDFVDEAEAKITLLEIGIRRAEAKLEVIKTTIDVAPEHNDEDDGYEDDEDDGYEDGDNEDDVGTGDNDGDLL